MNARDDAYLRHQQARFMRPDAARFIRPDAARFLKPGTRVEDVFPALARKYSPNQPRVPAGNPDGGQWTDGSDSGRPRVYIYGTNPDNDESTDAGGSDSGFGLSLPRARSISATSPARSTSSICSASNHSIAKAVESGSRAIQLALATMEARRSTSHLKFQNECRRPHKEE